MDLQVKNNFKSYGFSGDFEGEILKEIGGIYIGYYIDNNIVYSCSWVVSTGECSIDKKFNLTPIKKKWYEEDQNINWVKGAKVNLDMICRVIDDRDWHSKIEDVRDYFNGIINK